MTHLADLAPPPYNDRDGVGRAVFIGTTGSGKTTLACQMLKLRPYVLVFDVKGTLTPHKGWTGYAVHRSLAKLVADESPRLMYRPDFEELNDPAVRDRFFEFAYKRQHTTVYVDEVYGVLDGTLIPWHYGACLTRGREIGVEVWSATQRPSFIPNVILSESEHAYVFRLRMEGDREKVESVTGIPAEVVGALGDHRFYYAPQDGDVIGPLKLRLDGAITGNARSA
jgi:hypothetical protein